METESSPNINHPPGILRRFSRWLFSWKTFRRALIALLGLITLVALLWTEENWRGKHDWERYKRKWEAKGEKFDWAAFAPHPVPDRDNFAATPFLAPLLHYRFVDGQVRWDDSNGVARANSVSIGEASFGDWRKGEECDLKAAANALRPPTNSAAVTPSESPAQAILADLSKYNPVLKELRAASRRPYAVYFSFSPGQMETMVMFEHWQVLRKLARLAVLQALADLEVGHNESALTNVEFTLFLEKSLRSEPLVLSQLLRNALLYVALQPVWEGLVQHRWTQPRLIDLQDSLASMHLFVDYGKSMRGERAFTLLSMAQVAVGRAPGQRRHLFSLMPMGLVYQNQIAICRLFQQILLPAVDARSHRVDTKKLQNQFVRAVLGRRNFYNIFAWMLWPAFERTAEKVTLVQVACDEAAIACALERYRIANGYYPETLRALSPRFLSDPPKDPFTGNVYLYRRHGNSRYLLYSVGWNGIDDGGVVRYQKDGHQIDPEQGDWVWPWPSNHH